MKVNSHNMTLLKYKYRNLRQTYTFLTPCPTEIERVLKNAQLVGGTNKKENNFFTFAKKGQMRGNVVTKQAWLQDNNVCV